MTVKESNLQYPSAWHRFGARMFDFFLFGFVFMMLTDKIIWLRAQPLIYYALNMIFVIVSEGYFIHKTNSTPGKMFLGLVVVGQKQQAISFKTACYRTFWAYVKGLWMGIPVMMFVPAWFSRRLYQKTGTTVWDEAAQTKVLQMPSTWFRVVLFVFIFFLLIFLIGNYHLFQKAFEQGL
ncbi:MAG: RDD family protein [Acidaminococcaceae bacterium]|nr:RDD family protein [Acidaminococcaceae bacterium]